MKTFGSRELKTIIEDVEYLRLTWNPKTTSSKLRRDCVILRRLFVDNDFYKAWNFLRIKEKPRIIAPKVEFYLEADTSNTIDFLVAGGGEFSKVQFACLMHQKRKVELKFSKDVNPIEHDFSLEQFLKSLSIYVFGVNISRLEVIKYVSNKLGSAHLDSSRSGSLGLKFAALDENFERLVFKDADDQEQLLVYLELLSIGQLFAKSTAATELCKRA